MQDMEQGISFLDAIDREAIKCRADAHPWISLPGKGITLKTTQTFFKNSFELHLALWSLLEKVKKNALLENFLSFSSAPSLSLHRPPREHNYFCAQRSHLKTLLQISILWTYQVQ